MDIPSDDDRFALPRDIPDDLNAGGSAPTLNPSRLREGSETCGAVGGVSRSGVGELGTPTEDWRTRGLAHPAGRGWARDPVSGREQGARLIADYGHELRPPKRIPGDPPVEYVDADALAFFAPGAPLAKFGTPERVRFLDCLASCGEVRAAAARAGVSRETVYRARRRTPGFARLWDAALVHARARAEGELLTRALDGVKVPVFHGGECVATWRRHDARYLLALLARLDRRVEEDFSARRLAERFDEELAAMAGHAAPPDFAEAAEAVRYDDYDGHDEAGDGDRAARAPTREEYVVFHRSAALAAFADAHRGRVDEEAEGAAMRAAGQAAGAAHDAWREAGMAMLDALLDAAPPDADGPGEAAGPDEAGDEAHEMVRPPDPPFEVKSAPPRACSGKPGDRVACVNTRAAPGAAHSPLNWISSNGMPELSAMKT